MEYIRWKEEMSVGIDAIDSQHKELFRLINAFYNSISGNSGKANILQAIQDMENYSQVHFRTEEKMMQKANYPKILEHKNEHLKFIETVADFRKRYEDGRLLLSLEVSQFVKDWITNHILRTDQLYMGKIE